MLTDGRWVTCRLGYTWAEMTALGIIFGAIAYGHDFWKDASGDGDEHLYRLLELVFAVEGQSNKFCHEIEIFVARYKHCVKKRSLMSRSALQFCFWNHPGSL